MMKFVLLSLLAITTLSQEEDPVDVKCNDGVTISGTFSDDPNTCTCSCATSTDPPTCISLTEAKEAFTTSTPTDTTNARVLEMRTSAGRSNTRVAPGECIDPNTLTSQLVFDSTATVCSATIITCDQSSSCDRFNAAEAQYACAEDHTCRKKLCEINTDQFHNKVSSLTLDFSVEQSNDGNLCSEICAAPTTQAPQTTGDECSTGILSRDNLCYYPCVLDSDDIRRYSDAPIDIANVFGDMDALAQLKKICTSRNSELETCPRENIFPRVIGTGAFGDAYSKDRVNCGCGECIERCDIAAAERYVPYQDGDSDSDILKCKKIVCDTREEVTYASDVLSGQTAAERYVNIRRTVTETDVEITFCKNDAPVDEPTPRPVTCDAPCGDIVDPICVYDTVAMESKTFKCPQAVACAIKAAGDTDRFDFDRYGACRDPKQDQCTIDTMRATDRYSAISQCPLICKCIANPRGGTYGNIEICDTMERNFENLKKECAQRLDVNCRFEDLYFSECPLKDDSNVCDKLLCDRNHDPNDPAAGGICRKSSERFADTGIIARNEATGCQIKVCDRDENSPTYGDLIAIRYDSNTIDARLRIMEMCPRLADCTSLTVNTNGVCNACPTCDDDACDRDTLRRAGDACLEDPADDPSRENPDGSRDDFVGKIRIKVAARFCADDFFAHPRSEMYAFIKEAAYTIAGECSNIEINDLSALRAYISDFDYEVVVRTSSDTCDTVIKVIFRVDLCDVEVERLRKLLTCFRQLKDNDTVDLRARMADAIKENSKGVRFSRTTSSSDPDALDEDGAGVSAAASAADINLTYMNGDPMNEFDVMTTPQGGCGETGCKGNGAGMYGFMVAVIMVIVFTCV